MSPFRRSVDAMSMDYRQAVGPHPLAVPSSSMPFLVDAQQDERGGADERDDAERSAVAPVTGPRILVVDDNSGIRSLARTILAAAGNVVTTAETADEAVHLLDTGAKFDLVLSDVVMPGERDGFALAREVVSRCPGVAIILMSGYMPDAGQTWPTPASFLRKPFHRGELIDAVRTALASRQH